MDQESTLSSGRSTPAMMHGGAGVSGGSKGYACLWDGCLQGFLSSPDLAEHLRAEHLRTEHLRAHGHTQIVLRLRGALAAALAWGLLAGEQNWPGAGACPQLGQALGPTEGRKGWGEGTSDKEFRAFVPGNLWAAPSPTRIVSLAAAREEQRPTSSTPSR